MALFVALIVSLILYVLIYQLWHSALLETRIARNQGGYMQAGLALNSAFAYAVALVKEDMVKDAEGAAGGALSSLSGLTGGTGAPAAAPAVGGAVQPGGQPATGPASPGVDYLHKALFQPRNQTVNGVSVKVEITDCERCLNLNRLFDMVHLWAREDDAVARVGDPPREGGDGTPVAAGAAGERDMLRDIMSLDPALSGAEEEQQWVEPDEAQIEAAVRMVADLIIHMVESNIENGIDYRDQYDADVYGRRIVDYVLERKRSEYQNTLFSVAELLQVEGMTAELYHGPLPREVADPGLGIVEGQEGFRRDDFGDVIYDFGVPQDGPWFLDRLGGFADVGQLKEQVGLRGSMMPGITGLRDAPLPDNEYGTGIVRPPRPIGIKHLFCTFSSGKVNLNTAPMEVIMAVLQGGGDTGAWDANDKLEVGRVVVWWRDQYTEQYLKELEQQELEGFAEDYVYTDAYDFSSAVAAEDLRTNVYTSLADLEKIEVDGEQILKAGIDSGTSERSPGWLVRKDLARVAAFRSEFFNVRLVAAGEGFRHEAEFVLHRDVARKQAVSVVYYRERRD